MKVDSNLARVLEAGHFAVTAEVSPPQNTELQGIREKASMIKGFADAVNIPDGQAAVVAMASWAGCLVASEEGLDPIIHMTCRDRNRIALQMDVLAASAFGIANILCLSGDPISFGSHPQAAPVFDLDSIQLIRTVKGLRDERKFDNGELIVGAEPRLFIGAAIDPFVRPLDSAVERLKAKVEAGADFIQTQPVYNMEGFRTWMELVRAERLHKDVKILAGLTPITSLAAARYMKMKVSGVDIPDMIIERLKSARNKEEAAEEGLKIVVETIEQLRQLEGVAGVHIMTLQREELIPRICSAAGLHPRP
ncbi:MAG: methylenetetrahydrofolate reductase [Dehalococcoidia bacterium]|nr:methylenetetrahydrofolate reductase [Dehalococcoidia bacterium]